MSGIYTVENTFQLSFKNEPDGMRVTKMVDSTLSIKITARGFAILNMNLFNDMDNLIVNLNNYTIESKGGVSYAIFTQELTTKLAKLTGISENNIQFPKAMIVFDMEKTGEKTVPIVPNYSLSFVSQYDLYNNVTSNPAYVTLYGAHSILDTINSILTKELLLTNLMSSKLVEVDLVNPNTNTIAMSVNKTELNIKVEKFTESQFTIPINLVDLPYKIKTFPSDVTVYFRVAQSDFNNVLMHQFEVSLSVNNIDVTKATSLPLKLVKQPSFVRNVRVVPSKVEFLIIK